MKKSILLLWPLLLVPGLLGNPRPAVAGENPGSEEAGDADWNHFRGPSRTGVSRISGLQRSWPEGGPKILWKRPLGDGFSAISTAGENLYTLYAAGDDEFVGCFRIADGSEVWRARLGPKYLDEWGDGPRSTPIIDGGLVYALGTSGRLLALDSETGDLAWQVDLTATYGQSKGRFSMEEMLPEDVSHTAEFGHCISPLVEGDLLLVYTGAGEGKSLAALDKRTGETRWTAFDRGSGHSTPIAVTIGGQRQIVQVMPFEIAAVGLSGETLWSFPWAE